MWNRSSKAWRSSSAPSKASRSAPMASVNTWSSTGRPYRPASGSGHDTAGPVAGDRPVAGAGALPDHPSRRGPHDCRRDRVEGACSATEWSGDASWLTGAHCTAVPLFDPSDPAAVEERSALLAAAARWRRLDPDDETRTQLDGLVARAEAGDIEPLAAAFAGRVGLGTAGPARPHGAGPGRHEPPGGAPGHRRGRLAGARGRHGRGGLRRPPALGRPSPPTWPGSSPALGRRAVLLPGPLPTPVVAFAVRHLARRRRRHHHRVPQPGGRQRLQGVPGRRGPDRSARRGAAGGRPRTTSPIATTPAIRPRCRSPPIRSRPTPRSATRSPDAYVATVVGRLRPGPRQAVTWPTPPCTEWGGRSPSPPSPPPASRPWPRSPSSARPTATSRPSRFPNPEEPGALDLLVARADEVGADVGLAHDPDADRLGVVVRAGRELGASHG